MTLYLVTRTSNCGGNESPCDGAILIVRQNWAYVTRKSNIAKKSNTEYGVWSDGICWRLEDKKCWAVEIDNLQSFVKEHGPIILSAQGETDHGPNEEPMFEIEIYDDYRE